jgi:hypothetical protein
MEGKPDRNERDRRAVSEELAKLNTPESLSMGKFVTRR